MACVSTCLIISPKLPPHSNFSLKKKKKSLIHIRSPLGHDSFPRLVTKRVSRTRHGISSVRAASSYEFSGFVEGDKIPKDVRKRAMKAVDECDLRVRVGDVASRGGLTVMEAQKALRGLAADTDGFLEVSNEGDLLYVIPRDYRSKLGAKPFPIFLEKAKVVVPYLIRGILYTVIIGVILYIIFITKIIKLMNSLILISKN